MHVIMLKLSYIKLLKPLFLCQVIGKQSLIEPEIYFAEIYVAWARWEDGTRLY